MSKAVVTNLKIAVASLVVFFGVSELLVRIYYPGLLHEQQMFVPADYMDSAVLKKNLDKTVISKSSGFQYHVTTNKLGLRSLKEISLIKTDGSYRILCLGDSFTFGLGVNDDETYPHYLEKIFSDNRLEDISVINAGFADGWGPGTEYLYLKSKIERLDPDLVILGFCMESDLTDVWKNEWILAENGLPTDIIHPGNKIPTFIKHNIGLYQFLRIHFAPAIQRFLLGIESGQSEFPYYDEAWERVQHLILSMKTISNDHGARFVILTMPTKDVVLDEKYGKTSFGLSLSGQIIDFGRDNDIPVIDLVEPFSTYTTDKLDKMHINKEGHWNNAGTLETASVIYSILAGDEYFKRDEENSK